jgi:hypothetical protein
MSADPGLDHPARRAPERIKETDMSLLTIDDFATGPHAMTLLSGAAADDSVQNGTMLGGARRTRFAPGNGTPQDPGFRRAPFHFEVGNGFCEVVSPVRGQCGLTITYGSSPGSVIALDLRQAQGLQIAVQAHTNTSRAGALAVELRSSATARSMFNAQLVAPDVTGTFVIPLRFDDPRVFKVTGETAADPAKINLVTFIFTINEGIALNSFDVI